jgi:hypothetical protein
MSAEWTKSTSTESSIRKLIDGGLLPDAAIRGWRSSIDESFLDPCPGELIVFEDFYWCRFGTRCHPFLCKLLDYYKVSLCSLHPNSILSISIFINLCEAYLGIHPHFNLWRHFFYLKKKGGSRGSKIAEGAYLLLRDHMKAHYLNVPLNTSMRDWYHKWFYMQQEQEPFVACDVSQIPKQHESWSVRPTCVEMEQVQDLLGLFDRNQIDGPIVTTNLIFRQVQPCKERVHLMYEYSGSDDVTQE